MNFKLTAASLLLGFLVSGCSTSPVLVAEGSENWNSYRRCGRVVGYYQKFNGVKVVLYVATKSSAPSVNWVLPGSDKLIIEFEAPQPQIEITFLPSGKILRQPLKFEMEQQITTEHPEVPKGMTTSYDHARGVVLYGTVTKHWGGVFPDTFEVKGELKSPRFVKTKLQSRTIDATPAKGYQRTELRAIFWLGQDPVDDPTFQRLVVELPAFRINGELVKSEKLQFHMAQKWWGVGGSAKNCGYSQSEMPSMLLDL